MLLESIKSVVPIMINQIVDRGTPLENVEEYFYSTYQERFVQQIPRLHSF